MPNLYFIVFDQAEVLDFSGPFDVFSMARIANPALGDAYQMHLVSVDGKPISGIHGFKVMVDAALSDIAPDQADIVIFPGGGPDLIEAISNGEKWLPEGFNANSQLTKAQKDKLAQDCAAIVAWAQGPGQKAGILMTVCVGAFFGAKAGFFTGLKATTHHQFVDLFQQWTAPETKVNHGARYVMNPQTRPPFVMSSGGVSAGIDLSFELLGLVMGTEAQGATATLMEYNRTINTAVTRPTLTKCLTYNMPAETA